MGKDSPMERVALEVGDNTEDLRSGRFEEQTGQVLKCYN